MALDVLKEMIRQVEADGYKVESPRFNTSRDNFCLIFTNPERRPRVIFELPGYVAGVTPQEITTTVRTEYEKRVKELSTAIMRDEAYKHGVMFIEETPEPEMARPEPPMPTVRPLPPPPAPPQPPAGWDPFPMAANVVAPQGGGGGFATRAVTVDEIRQIQAANRGYQNYGAVTGRVTTNRAIPVEATPSHRYQEIYRNHDLARDVPADAPEQAPQPANPEGRYRAPILA